MSNIKAYYLLRYEKGTGDIKFIRVDDHSKKTIYKHEVSPFPNEEPWTITPVILDEDGYRPVECERFC